MKLYKLFTLDKMVIFVIISKPRVNLCTLTIMIAIICLLYYIILHKYLSISENLVDHLLFLNCQVKYIDN